jgi:hypothetical protein
MSLTINGTLHGKPFTIRMGGPAIAESGQLKRPPKHRLTFRIS